MTHNANRLPRRRFLAAATAAVGAPYVITSTALGADDRPPASERITMGMIGPACGGATCLRVSSPIREPNVLQRVTSIRNAADEPNK